LLYIISTNLHGGLRFRPFFHDLNGVIELSKPNHASEKGTR